MTYSKLTITSASIFIQEYLLRDTDSQLKSLSNEVINILNSLSFYHSKKGYRDILYANIPDIDDYRFTMDLFSSFVTSKLAKAKDSTHSVYSIELDIDDNIVNETFEAIAIDEYGDKILYSLMLDEYDKETHTLSFMLI